MASTEYYICEQCGAPEFKSQVDLVRVFGKVFYFCSDKCRNFWMNGHTRTFSEPK